jgi:NTE family protein
LGEIVDTAHHSAAAGPSITAAGVLRAEKILDEVRDILGPVTIEELPIPYTAVATDLLTGKSVWFQRGPIDAAIRASIAIPGVIAPHEIDGRLLADGGILDPVPMTPIAAINADLTIAVSLNGSEPGATLAGPAGPDVPPEIPKLGGFDVMNRTIDIAQSALARHTLAAYPPDLLIEVPRTTCRSLDDFDIDADFSDP